jgi:hypothetical protein
MREPWSARGFLSLALLVALAVGAGIGAAEEQPKTAVKTEPFDKDPGWEGHNNRIVPRPRSWFFGVPCLTARPPSAELDRSTALIAVAGQAPHSFLHRRQKPPA